MVKLVYMFTTTTTILQLCYNYIYVYSLYGNIDINYRNYVLLYSNYVLGYSGVMIRPLNVLNVPRGSVKSISYLGFYVKF